MWSPTGRTAKVVGVSFIMGVVTGIPMEFSSAAWSQFSPLNRGRDRAAAGHGRHIFLVSEVGFIGVVTAPASRLKLLS
jgi:hypothetical protein